MFPFTPADSLPINIVVAGAPVKNISLLRVGERSGVGCTVDSCLPSQYTVRFLSPSGVEVQNSITSTSMLMTFNWQAPVTSSLADGNYTCEVRWDQERIDRAVFQFAGEHHPNHTIYRVARLGLACSECHCVLVSSHTQNAC